MCLEQVISSSHNGAWDGDGEDWLQGLGGCRCQPQDLAQVMHVTCMSSTPNHMGAA